MNTWIAFEYDEAGRPSEAYLAVVAEDRAAATMRMAAAIREHAGQVSRAKCRRIWDVFIEAPQLVAVDDPRSLVPDEHGPARFVGFDQPRVRRRQLTAHLPRR